jgi:phosphoribosylanthranilate isomerase
MSPIVKICGLKTPEAVAASLEAGADMLGFVLFQRSPRFRTAPEAAALAGAARGRAEIVALLVDPSDEAVTETVNILRPDWLQLHGGESVERTAAIRAASGIKVMKALGIRAAGDMAAALAYRDVADRLLFDAKPPRDAERPGGHGKTFDWNLLSGAGVGYMLSGGLTPDNVGEAIRITGAAGVDVSSGVEISPGVKSPQLIRDFIRAARAATGPVRQPVFGASP